MEYVFSKATKEDVPAIIVLHGELADHHKKIDKMWLGGKETKKVFTKYLKANLTHKDFYWMIIKTEDMPVGYFAANITTKCAEATIYKKAGYISDGYLSQKHRGKGLAKEAVKFFIKWFKTKGIKLAQIGAVSKNTDGMRTWEKLGFVECSRKLNKII